MSDAQIDSQTEPCPACGSVLDVTGAQIFAERTCPVCGTQINVRRTFGHYELTGAVGHGGQGIVYRAVDNTLNRMVALKLLRTEYSNDPDFVRQFESEARITASINHPNVVRVYSFGSGEGHVFLAMELVDNGTFDDLMEKKGRVPEARALQVGIEIAQGLKAGSERGLVHRDVKPGNILFAQDGTSKIVDYGLAMFFEQSAAQTGEIWGTPYYLSPERLNRVQEDFRSDIYSLGATLFHAIAGRPPFEAEDASHVALKHLRTQAASIQAFAPDVSNATAYVINRTLAKNPSDRQESYDEFIEQLQFAREEVLARARGGGSQQKARVVLDDVGSQRASSWVTIATLAVLVVGLVIGGIFVVKIMGGDKGSTEAPTEIGATTLEKYGPGWIEAKSKLLAGQFAAAAGQFNVLASKHEAGSTERSWAIVLESLARQLNGDSEGAGKRLSELQGGGTQVSKFYSEQVGPRLIAPDGTPASYARDFSRSNHESLAPFFFALRDLELNKFDDARTLMGQFMSAKPDANVAWLSDLRTVAKPIQDELEIFGQAQGRWKSAKTFQEKESAMAELRQLPGRFSSNSRISDLALKLMAEAGKELEDVRAERMKINVVMGSKIAASSWNQQTNARPEYVVDGDPKTRWRNGDGDTARTLTFDLGSPKTMSRWVIRTESAAGEKADLNLSEAKLQQSADGKNWTDVDWFKENRFGIVDRVVKEFTSQYVRVVGVRAVKDSIARIHELEVTKADEQAKTTYGPAEPVATRFTADNDFIAGPIGNPGALGSVKYDGREKSYVVKGSGSDVWGNNDNFQFIWQPIKGDCEVVACVRSFETKHEWSKALVMIRSELTKDASHCSMAIGADGKNQLLWRSAPGQNANSANKDNIKLPYWIKVVRKGNEVTGYTSPDGKKWSDMGKQQLNGMHEVAYVGFGACSHVDGQLVTAKFTDVTVTGAKP